MKCPNIVYFQVKFNLDPETIFMDPSLPAAATMDPIISPIQSGVDEALEAEVDAIVTSDAIVAADDDNAENDNINDAASKSDAGAEESGNNADDQEETDTGSTISSVVAVDSYRSR